jgi:hypothetical protein
MKFNQYDFFLIKIVLAANRHVKHPIILYNKAYPKKSQTKILTNVPAIVL